MHIEVRSKWTSTGMGTSGGPREAPKVIMWRQRSGGLEWSVYVLEGMVYVLEGMVCVLEGMVWGLDWSVYVLSGIVYVLVGLVCVLEVLLPMRNGMKVLVFDLMGRCFVGLLRRSVGDWEKRELDPVSYLI